MSRRRRLKTEGMKMEDSPRHLLYFYLLATIIGSSNPLPLPRCYILHHLIVIVIYTPILYEIFINITCLSYRPNYKQTVTIKVSQIQPISIIQYKRICKKNCERIRGKFCRKKNSILRNLFSAPKKLRDVTQFTFSDCEFLRVGHPFFRAFLRGVHPIL